MKLTSEDKDLLRQWGFDDKDFPQIELATQARYTKYQLGNKSISSGPPSPMATATAATAWARSTGCAAPRGRIRL